MVLAVLGLDPETETVYNALLTQSSIDLHGVVHATGLTEHQVRKALDDLADRAFLRPSRQTQGALRAVSPQIALDLVVRRQEADLARRAQELAASRAAAAEAVAAYGTLTPNQAVDGTERLVGMDAIEAKLETLAQQVRSECLSVMPGGAQSQASLDASKPLDTDALDRGITLWTLYQDSVRNDTPTHTYAQWLTDNGGEVRTAPLLPCRMLIFDRHTAVVPINPADTKAGALCTREPGIVASLTAVFEQAWATAIPLGAAPARHTDNGLTATERELLTLLAGGLTDEAVAKRLGIGLRTVRRHMAGLMERLNATSRFEAGLKAAQHGWL